MKPLSRPLGLLLATALLVLGFDLATYAANGDSLLAGKLNSATKATKIKRSSTGPALDLKVKAGSAPLKVNSTGKVAKLNADTVDGLSSAELLTTARVLNLTLTSATGAPAWDLVLPVGRYLLSWEGIFATQNGAGESYCGVRDDSTGAEAIGDRHVQPSNFVPNLSASGSIVVTSTSDWEFYCDGSDIGNFLEFEGIDHLRVTLVPLASAPVTNVAVGPN